MCGTRRLRGRSPARRGGYGTLGLAGLGWGDATRGRSRVGFVADVGVVYWGRPTVSLGAAPVNPALVPPGFYENLEVERRKIEDDLSEYRFFPVVSLGLAYRF